MPYKNIKQNHTEIKEVKLSYCKITFDGDLVRLIFFKNQKVDKEQAKEYCEIIENNYGEYPFASIAYAEKGVNWTYAARKHLGSREPNQYAAAMVANTPVLRIIANFFMKISRPKYPTRFFDSFEDAEAWIVKLKTEFYDQHPELDIPANETIEHFSYKKAG